MLFISLVKFFLAATLVLFLPGYLLMRAFLAHAIKKIPSLEQLIISIALSIATTDFLLMFCNYLGVALSQLNIIVLLLGFCIISWAIAKKRTLLPSKEWRDKSTPVNYSFSSLNNHSYRQIIIFFVIFIFLLTIRTVYVAEGILPQTTDLGHHMYWAKKITATGQLPDYEESVLEDADRGKFIIGEHIVFAAIGTISSIDYISPMPAIILHIINILSLVAVAVLAYYIALPIFSSVSAKNIFLFSLVVIGSFYAISSPQSGYVTRGVIGNIFGNFFIPLILYSLTRTISIGGQIFSNPNAKNDPPNSTILKFYTLLVTIFTATLAYTHHLSTFVFLYVLAGTFLLLVLLLLVAYLGNIKKTFFIILKYLKIFFNARNLLLIFLFVLFILFIMPPSYLNKTAIDTAVGTPVKSTRTGMDINSIALTAGPWKFFYGWLGLTISGIFSLALIKKDILKISESAPSAHRAAQIIFSFCLIASWLVMIFLMSYRPSLLKVDIPSNRIASYITLPFALLASIGVYMIIKNARKKLPPYGYILFSLAIIGTGMISGLSDVSESYRANNGTKEIHEVYRASEYLKTSTRPEEMILKDHIYLPADSWIKVFLMRGYKNPLSRTFLRKYEDPLNPRETCTRDMIASPDSAAADLCYEETKTKYILLKQGFDTDQFDRSQNFSKTYMSDNVVIYKKNN